MQAMASSRRLGIEAGVDFKGTRLMEQGDIAADLIAQAALLAQFEKQPRTGGFAEHQAEQAQRVARVRVAARRVPGERKLELVGLALFG